MKIIRGRRRRRSRRASDEPFRLDTNGTVRQIAQFETGTGGSHGPVDIAIAFVGAVAITAFAAASRALGRKPKGRP